MTWDLAFNSKPLETQFLQLLKSSPDKEIGGFLIAHGAQVTLGEIAPYHDLWGTAFITQVVVVPNIHPEPQRHYLGYETKKHDKHFFSQAVDTGRRRTCFFRWHSHPSNQNRPSQRDLLVARQTVHGCMKGYTVIATQKPFRLLCHQVDDAGRSGHKSGKFYSWSRSPKLKSLPMPVIAQSEGMQFIQIPADLPIAI